VTARNRTSLRLRAPAKVNWSLEVLGPRPDGYHEVRTVLQTVALSDRLTLAPSEHVTLELAGGAGSLADEPLESNLAYRAAMLLRREFGAEAAKRSGRQMGARIVLEKRIPVAAGLGGGSSDAAAVLCGLRALWGLSTSDAAIESVAAELGADVPFFLRGGTALASARGEAITPLLDGPAQRLVLAWPTDQTEPEKTAGMYSALRRNHYTDGSATERLAVRLDDGHPITETDLRNVFQEALLGLDSGAAEAFRNAAALGIGTPHLAGSGPSIFFLLEVEQPSAPLRRALGRLGLTSVETHTLPAVEAVAQEKHG